MTDGPNSESSERQSRELVPRPLKVGVGWLLAIGAAFFGAALVTCSYHLVAGGSEDDGSAKDETVVRPTADVVVAVRDLARLESASYHIQRIVDLREEQKLFGLVEVEDAILVVAAGDIRAGVDLSEMADDDVEVDPEKGIARLVLPPPRIFETRLDNQRTYVHTRDTDLLARRDETLESRARREAERTLRQAALDAGIIDRARRNAEQTIAAFVRSLGYREVDVRWRRE